MLRYPEALDLSPKQIPLIMMIGLRLERIEYQLANRTHQNYINPHSPTIFKQHHVRALEYTEEELTVAQDRIKDIKHHKSRMVLYDWASEVDRLWDIAAALLFQPCQITP